MIGLEKKGPLSINIKDERAQEILQEIDKHNSAIVDLLQELRHLTIEVETEINRSLTTAMTNQ